MYISACSQWAHTFHSPLAPAHSPEPTARTARPAGSRFRRPRSAPASVLCIVKSSSKFRRPRSAPASVSCYVQYKLSCNLRSSTSRPFCLNPPTTLIEDHLIVENACKRINLFLPLTCPHTHTHTHTHTHKHTHIKIDTQMRTWMRPSFPFMSAKATLPVGPNAAACSSPTLLGSPWSTALMLLPMICAQAHTQITDSHIQTHTHTYTRSLALPVSILLTYDLRLGTSEKDLLLQETQRLPILSQ